VIFELPGFTTAASGTEESSLDALRKASATSYYKGNGSLWVKLVSSGDVLTDTDSVIWAESVAPPEIIKVNLPESIWPKRIVVAEMEIAHLAPALARFGSPNTNVTFHPGPTPTLVYNAPAAPIEEQLMLIVLPGILFRKRRSPYR